MRMLSDTRKFWAIFLGAMDGNTFVEVRSGSRIIKALVFLGRSISVLLCVAQSILLVEFPITYESNHLYWLLLLLYSPAFAVLLWYARGRCLRYLWRVWLLYIMVLNITATLVFILVGHQLSEERFFGPHVFEMSLCISPLLLFLLLNVASDSSEDRRLVISISFRLTLDLFDGIEMLAVTIEKGGRPRDGVPKEMQIVIAVLVLVVFFLSAFELRDQHFEDVDDNDRERTASFRVRTVIHLVLNAAFLVLRLILWIEFERPAPMFTAKSGISIMVYIIEVVKSCS